MNSYIEAVRQNPLGALVGPLALILGAVLIWVYLRGHKRSIQDGVAILVGAVLLIALLLVIVIWKESAQGSTFAKQWMGLTIFAGAGFAVWWLLNKGGGHKPEPPS